MVEEKVIAEDQCTDAQLKRIARRAKRGLPWNLTFPLGAPSSHNDDEQWYLRSEAKCSDLAFDTELVPWPMLEADAILEDRCTKDQVSLIERREQRAAKGLPSQMQIQQRRIDLQKALAANGPFRGFEEPGLQSSFLRMEFPLLERESALAAMRARWAQDKAQESLQYDQLAEQGESFVAWPTDRRWPKQSCAWSRHAAWFALWRAKAPKPTTLSTSVLQKFETPRMERSNSLGSLASWQALSEISWQEVADVDVCFEDMLTSQDAVSSQHAQGLEALTLLKAECEQDLVAAMPAVEAAVAALNCLAKGDLVEIKALARPPAGVVLTGKALCRLFQVKPVRKGGVMDFWEPATKLLGDATLLQKMVQFDKDNVPESVFQKVAVLCKNPLFQPDVIKKASCAAAGICQWVHAIASYLRILKELAPKRAALAAAEKAYNDACKSLEEVQEKTDMDVPAPEPAHTANSLEDLATENVNKTTDALACVKMSDIQELKSLGKPPMEVHVTCAACCMLMTSTNVDLTWKDIQKIMSNPAKFVNDLQAVDIDRISKEAVLKCSLIAAASQSFTAEVIKAKSMAAACLADWVINVVKYHETKNKLDGIANEISSTRETHLGEEFVALNTGMKIPRASSGKIVEVKTEDILLSISKKDISELKSLAKPPQAVMKLMVCVNILLSNGDKEEGWGGAKRMMADPSFLLKLQSFKTEDVTVEQLQETQAILDSDDAFLDDNLRKVSGASYGLLVWVRSFLSEKAVAGITSAPRFW
jgi:hypothetical protein